MKNTLTLLILIMLSLSLNAQRKDSLYYYNKRKISTMIPDSANWYNSRSFQVFDHEDKIILIHLWDPNDLNSFHSLKEIEKIDQKFPTVLPVSVAKSDNEGSMKSENIKTFLGEHKFIHPFVVPPSYDDIKTLNDLKVPSVGLIIEGGKLVRTFEGAGYADELEESLDSLIKVNKALKLSSGPILEVSLDPSIYSAGLMDHPSDVCVSGDGKIFISDGGNNRIIVSDEEGKLMGLIGMGVKGNVDGSFHDARFNSPSGMAYDQVKRLLYFSDRENHSIKAANLLTGDVFTVLGSGSRSTILETEFNGKSSKLNYPEGLAFKDNYLYICNSGANQIIKFDTRTFKGNVLAGRGEPKSIDGLATEASFANPIDLDFNENGELLVLEGITSNIRKVSVEGVVTTEFENAAQKRPLSGAKGFRAKEGKMYFADQFGHSISVWDGKNLSKIVGSGEPGLKNGKKEKAMFYNPSDIEFLGNELLVLEKGNESLRMVRAKKKRVSSFDFTDISLLFEDAEAFNTGTRVFLKEIDVALGEENVININIDIGDGRKWVKAGRNQVKMDMAGENELDYEDLTEGKLQVRFTGSETNLNVMLQVYMTLEDAVTGKMEFRSVLLVQPYHVVEGADTEHDVIFNIDDKPKKVNQ